MAKIHIYLMYAHYYAFARHDRLVSINDSYLPDHEYTDDRDLLSRSPGKSFTVDYLTKEGRKVTVDGLLDVAR